MKPLTCEMCGSTDLMKQDGAFVCQYCGMKYSVEEAKKMMIEGTVDVQGTVKVDDSSKIENYYIIAENAYNASNQKEAESYCNKIIEIDPNNYRAWLLKGSAAGWQSTLANIRVEESINCFNQAIDNAPEDKVEEVKKTAVSEIVNVSVALMRLCCDNYSKYGLADNAKTIKNTVLTVQPCAFAFLAKCGEKATDLNASIALIISKAVIDAYDDIAKEYFESNDHPSKYVCDRYRDKSYAAIDLIDIANKLNNDDTLYRTRYQFKALILTQLKSSKSYRYSNGVWVIENTYSAEVEQKLTDMIMECHKKIKEIDPSYVIPEPHQSTSNGCYVATAVYGSYDCPQVWTLRRFRDYTLAETWYGRAFVHLYYAVSPTLVKWFGHTKWFKKMWRGPLDRMVTNLNAKGVEDTPYEDRNW